MKFKLERNKIFYYKKSEEKQKIISSNIMIYASIKIQVLFFTILEFYH